MGINLYLEASRMIFLYTFEGLFNKQNTDADLKNWGESIVLQVGRMVIMKMGVAIKCIDKLSGNRLLYRSSVYLDILIHLMDEQLIQ